MSICYLCSSEKSRVQYAQSGNFELSQCLNCGLVKTENVDPSALEALYKDAEYYSAHGGSGFDIEGFQALGLKDGLAAYYDKNRFQPIRKKYANEKPRLLDVGCSAGLFLAIAREYGWSVKGIETSPTGAKAAKEKLNLDVDCLPIESMTFTTESFDVVTMFHVLEHLYDPRASLQKLKPVLKPGGHLVLEVPNIASLPAKLRKKSWHGYVLPYHLWHFSPETLTLLLAQSGFEVVSLKTPYLPCSTSHIFNAHSWLASVIRKLLRKKSAPLASQASQHMSELVITSPTKRRWLERIIRNFYWPTDHLLSFLGLGEVIYVIARKK